ncbi:hypothetical protein [uncultured Pseudoramibacter sp.]|uniref:hypothetical protein n=1 Tax=uncultured Pseudoramibacter sp. TaxID=1623493 RepID=UPI0025E7C774|nr:hypothetical protein [uncultured Pseudoramibacter sp.]
MSRHPQYNGIKFYGPRDYSYLIYKERAEKLLNEFDSKKQFKDINKVIELYNLYEIFDTKLIPYDIKNKYHKELKSIIGVCAKFFNNLSEHNFEEEFNNTAFNYIDDFWNLFETYKVYKNIESIAFQNFLRQNKLAIELVLRHRDIVKYYDDVIAEYLRNSDHTAEILSKKFLEKKLNNEHKIYLPLSLKTSEFDMILQNYIDSEDCDFGIAKIIAESQSSKECPLSDKLRLKANKKVQEYWNKQIDHDSIFEFGVVVQVKSNPDIKTIDSSDTRNPIITYDINWIKDNLDYPTLMNNFIYLFEFTDVECRCNFVAQPAERSLLTELGRKGTREYERDIAFSFEEMKSSAEMQMYVQILAQNNIKIENIIKWFFSEYLPAEFDVEGFVFNTPSDRCTTLEKNKMLLSELDGIVKQFNMYVRDGKIDRELLEMSSNPVSMSKIPSFIERKYVYANSNEIRNEMELILSDQSLLPYTKKYGEGYDNFLDLIKNQPVKREDYSDYVQPQLDFLENRGVISFGEDGIIDFNDLRTKILIRLYYRQVICGNYCGENIEYIDNLVKSGDLRYGSTLLSEPEQDYMDFMLNKSKFSNGYDLRNKYIHSTYPVDEKQQENDYYHILKIVIIFIIKINEEFCLRDTLE